MSDCVVFYDSWQMECCGDPFSVGDSVSWKVYKNTTLETIIDVGKVDYCFDGHDLELDNLFSLTGKIEKIKILYTKYSLPEGKQIMVPVSEKIVECENTNVFEKNIDGMHASGYIVSLSDCVLESIN